MINNPEFLRNIWLEMTPHRLLSMPLVLGAYFFLLFMMGDHHLNHDDAMQALFIAGLLTLLWGSNKTAESVLSEVSGNTWDAQRMSAMPAWSLVWGKLMGSSVFSSYGALICFAVFVFASDFDLNHSLKMILIYLCAGLLAQASSMLLALLFIRKNSQRQRSSALAIAVVSAFSGMQFIIAAGHGAGETIWFSQSFLTLEFTLLSLIGWLLWSWMGCLRLMRAELQSPNHIWVWLTFVLWLVLFAAGFVSTSVLSSVLPLIVLSITIMLSYVMIFSESKDPVALGRMLSCLKQRRWSDLQFAMPCWLMTVLLMLLAAVLLPFDADQFAHSLGLPFSAVWMDYLSPGMIFTAVLFVVRDMCIILWLNFSSSLKRADMAAILYLALSYGLLPLILTLVGLGPLKILFLPTQGGGMLGLMIAAIEVALFFWLLMSRWQTNFGSLSQK